MAAARQNNTRGAMPPAVQTLTVMCAQRFDAVVHTTGSTFESRLSVRKHVVGNLPIEILPCDCGVLSSNY